MSVQLLPFQKLVDIPDVAHRHRRAIRRLAIASFVIISLAACMFMAALISTHAMSLHKSSALLWIFGVPFMILICILVCTSNILSLRNTDKWEPSDTCCNLMRSQPACCTKSCGSKHCCAQLSRVHIAVSVLASVFCVFFTLLVVLGCKESRYTDTYEDFHSNYSACSVVQLFDIPVLILMIFLVGTTARSAWLLTDIEHAQPDVTLLPEGKMVVQDVGRNVLQTVIGADAVVVGDSHSNDDNELETEQVSEQIV